MPSSFPFFRLPILIQLLVLKHLGILELFYLSIISKRSKHIVKSLNLTLSRVFWDLLSRRDCLVELTAPNRTGLYSCFQTSHVIRTPFDQINVNGIIVPVIVAWERNGIPAFLGVQTTSVEESLELMDKFTEHFLELFKVSKYEVRLPTVPNLRGWFVWKYTTRFEKVEVRDWLDGIRQLTSDDVNFVFEELTIDDSLDIGASIEAGVRYSGPLKMKKLCVRKDCLNGDWLTLEAILNMDCKKLLFDVTNTITYQDLNAIIEKWLTGGLKNLERIELGGYQLSRQDSINTKLDRVLEGIEHFPWDANNRPEQATVDYSTHTYGYNLKDGRDIRRSDGTIATVDFANNAFFVFYIWNQSSVNQ